MTIICCLWLGFIIWSRNWKTVAINFLFQALVAPADKKNHRDPLKKSKLPPKAVVISRQEKEAKPKKVAPVKQAPDIEPDDLLSDDVISLSQESWKSSSQGRWEYWVASVAAGIADLVTSPLLFKSYYTYTEIHCQFNNLLLLFEP